MVLGDLCRKCGPEVYGELEPVLMSGIDDNLERDKNLITEHPQVVTKLPERQSYDQIESERVI